MNYARRFARRAASTKQRRLAIKDQIRRGLLAERLEERSLLAADLAAFHSDYWNIVNPSDVNNDGTIAPNDALAIINELNATGSHTLQQGASGESGSRLYVDVNNDGSISPIDALIVINNVNAGEGQASPIAKYTVVALAAGTDTPITSIQAGQDFDLEILIEDLRTDGNPNRGIFSAYTDMVYDKALSHVRVGEVQSVTFTGSGSATLTLPGGTPITVGPFNFAAGSVTNRNNTLTALQNAFNATSLGSKVIVSNVKSSTGALTDQYSIWWSGEMDVNQPKLQSAIVSGTGTATVKDASDNAANTFVQVDGDPTIPASFAEAMRSRDLGLNDGLPGPYQKKVQGGDNTVDNDPNSVTVPPAVIPNPDPIIVGGHTYSDFINEMGAFTGSTDPLGNSPFELVRVRMKATIPDPTATPTNPWCDTRGLQGRC